MTDEVIAICDWWWWPSGESNSSKPIMQCKKPIKRQQSSGIEKDRPRVTNDTYLQRRNWINIKFSVLINIIITQYISIIYWNILQFPRPMTEHKFNNEYDVILSTLSLQLDHFENEDQLCAAQCIW